MNFNHLPTINEIKLAKIKRLPQNGSWEAVIVHLPHLICCKDNMDKDGFMGAFCALNIRETTLLRTKPFSNFPLEIDDAMDNFLSAILEYGSYPRGITICSEEAKDFLNELCTELNIRLTIFRDLKFIPPVIEKQYLLLSPDNDVEIDKELDLVIPELSEDSVDKFFNSSDDDFDFDTDIDDDINLDDDQAKRITAFLDITPNLQLLGMPYAIRLDLLFRLDCEKIRKKLRIQKHKLLKKTFERNYIEEYETSFRFRVCMNDKVHFDLKMNGAENLMCFSIFVRSPFLLDSCSGQDSIILPNNKAYHLSNMDDAIQMLANLGLKSGDTFAYKMKKEDEYINLECEVLSIGKPSISTEYPTVTRVVGLPLK